MFLFFNRNLGNDFDNVLIQQKWACITWPSLIRRYCVLLKHSSLRLWFSLSIGRANVSQHCLTSPSCSSPITCSMVYQICGCGCVHGHAFTRTKHVVIAARDDCFQSVLPLLSRWHKAPTCIKSSLGTLCHVCSGCWSALLRALPLLLLFYKIKFLLYATQSVPVHDYLWNFSLIRIRLMLYIRGVRLSKAGFDCMHCCSIPGRCCSRKPHKAQHKAYHYL